MSRHIDGKSEKRNKGFTLLEMLAVVALLGVMLLITVPKFGKSFLMNDVKKATRWMILQVEMLKQQAVQQKTDLMLNADLDSGKLWVTRNDMNEEMLENARSNAFELPDGLAIIDIEYPGGEKVASGIAKIRFSKEGYSDKALIHLSDDDLNQKTLVIETFLPRVKHEQEYKEFEN